MYNFDQIINNCFSNFRNKSIITVNKAISVPDLYIANIDTCIPIRKTDIGKINTSIYVLSVLDAPIIKNTKIGVLQVKIDQTPIYEYDIRIKNNLEKKNWKNYFFDIIKHINYL